MNQHANDTSSIDQIVSSVTKPHQPGLCFCCGKPLTGERVLWCLDCADPHGQVAKVANMLRRPSAGAAIVDQTA